MSSASPDNTNNSTSDDFLKLNSLTMARKDAASQADKKISKTRVNVQNSTNVFVCQSAFLTVCQ